MRLCPAVTGRLGRLAGRSVGRRAIVSRHRDLEVLGMSAGAGQGPVIDMATADAASSSTYFFEEVEIDGDIEGDLDNYQSVSEDASGDSDDTEVDLRRAIRSLDAGKNADAPGVVDVSQPEPPSPVIDDFFRNFLLQNGFNGTLATFQAEFYDKARVTNKAPGTVIIPDIYRANQLMEGEIVQMKLDLQKAHDIASQAKSTWDHLRKQRDFHRMHHRRVVQEKNKLVNDMKRMRKHYSTFEPTIKTLKEKYEGSMKEKMMMKIERDRQNSQIEALEFQLKSLESKDTSEDLLGRSNDVATKKSTIHSRRFQNDSIIPTEERLNPATDIEHPKLSVGSFALQKTYKGHTMAVAGLAVHPSQPAVATVSDDRSWKLWSLSNGELIMSGEGHRDWVSGCAFHPHDNLLATASGDGSVKLWDLANASCRATFSDHSQAVWGCAFHDLGDFLVSCSIDHTTKLWDLGSQRCRHTFRGHVDSVNFVAFQPYANNFATASGDKTVSIWDLRSGLCVQTFFGHHNAVNHVDFNYRGDAVASSDADGIVKLWDVRMVSEIREIETSQSGQSCNASVFDRSGSLIVSGSDEGLIKVIDIKEGNVQGLDSVYFFRFLWSEPHLRRIRLHISNLGMIENRLQ